MRVSALLWTVAAAVPWQCAAGAEMTVTLKPAETAVEFTVRGTLHTVHGTFQLKRGEIRLDPVTGNAAGQVVVDAASGSSGNGTRDRRMRRNVLESDRYPEIVFVPGRVEGNLAPEGPSQVQLRGILRIHGGEHEIAVPVTVEAAPGKITAAGEFDVPYVQWGMKNPGTLFLHVGDTVRISVRSVPHFAAASAAPSGGF